MENGRAENVGREQSRENGQDGEENEGLTIIIPEDLSSKIREKLKCLDHVLISENGGDQERATKPMIQKVPAMLREKENLKKYFEPKIVSIGPYHHENLNLKVTEEMKLKLAAMFIKEHAVNKENLFFKMKMEIKDLRKHYEPEATENYDDDDLAWMFLVDGCVVLHFTYVSMIYLDGDKKKRHEIVQAITDRYTFGMDLLLLENQVPYQVLKLIINSSQDSASLKKSILLFISRKTRIKLEENQELPLENATHLLDLMRTSFIFQSVSNNKKSGFVVQSLEQSIKIVGMLFGIFPRLIVRLLYHILPHKGSPIFEFHYIHELKEAGIELKPNNTGRLTDISFSRGTLRLPRIVVGQNTSKKLFNLIAYEMCPHFANDFEVSNSVFFLASLIARTKDTKELQVKKILYSKFDSNKKIVKLFRKIGSNSKLVPSYGYYSILEEIQQYSNNRHFDKTFNAWKDQLKNRYFDGPWSLIALVGAIIALGVTILQTVYTVLGYYKGQTSNISIRTPPST